MFFIFSLSLAFGILAKAQIKNSFVVSDNQDFDRIKFSLNATDGQCIIGPGDASSLMNIQRISEDADKPQYEELIVERTKQVKIHLNDESNSLSSSLSQEDVQQAIC